MLFLGSEQHLMEKPLVIDLYCGGEGTCAMLLAAANLVMRVDRLSPHSPRPRGKDGSARTRNVRGTDGRAPGYCYTTASLTWTPTGSTSFPISCLGPLRLPNRRNPDDDTPLYDSLVPYGRAVPTLADQVGSRQGPEQCRDADAQDGARGPHRPH